MSCMAAGMCGCLASVNALRMAVVSSASVVPVYSLAKWSARSLAVHARGILGAGPCMIRRCLVLMQSMAMGCELRRAGGWMLICDVSSCAPSLSSAITSWVNSWHLAFRRALIPPLSHDGASLVFVCLTFRTMLSVAFVGGSSASHTSEDGLSLHVSASLVYVCWHLLGWLSLLGAHCRRYDSSWHFYHTSWSWCAWWLGVFSASCQACGITCSIIRYMATSFAISGWRA